jgi:hypothetical protein
MSRDLKQHATPGTPSPAGGSYYWSTDRVQMPYSACKLWQLCPIGFSDGVPGSRHSRLQVLREASWRLSRQHLPLPFTPLVQQAATRYEQTYSIGTRQPPFIFITQEDPFVGAALTPAACSKESGASLSVSLQSSRSCAASGCSASQRPSADGAMRHDQLPIARPGTFMRAPLSRRSTSCTAQHAQRPRRHRQARQGAGSAVKGRDVDRLGERMDGCAPCSTTRRERNVVRAHRCARRRGRNVLTCFFSQRKKKIDFSFLQTNHACFLRLPLLHDRACPK